MKSFSKVRIAIIALAANGLLFASHAAWADVITIGASQDATLLGGSDAATDRSLADPGIFVGTDGQDNPRRGLIEFNIAGAVPAGSTITAVTLQLTVGQVAGSGGGGGSGSGETISLYAEPQAWGQPSNVAGSTSFGGAGHGGLPATGDATWNDAFYNTKAWTTAGGDWTSSLADMADTSVTGTLTSFTWSSTSMVANAQSWLDDPTANHGWIIKNADETDATDFRAFWSAQGAAADNNAALAPSLAITYIAPVPEPASLSLLAAGAALLMGRRRARRGD